MRPIVLFDHDGVLVDTERWYYRAGLRALSEIGVEITEAEYLRDMALGRGTWASARAAGVDETVIDRQRRRRDAWYQEHLRTEPIEIDGVEEVLAELSGRVRMAVVTTAKRADFDLIHEHRGIVPFMDLVLVREDYAHAKPHPEPYLTALERLGGTPDQALVVEDSARGLASAAAAAIDCVLVHHEFTAVTDASAAYRRIATLRELPAIVLGGTSEHYGDGVT